MKKYSPILLLWCLSCSTASDRVAKMRMNNNKSTERIYRLSSEKVFVEQELELVKRKPYPWENETEFAKITMNTLRCKGSHAHPTRKSGGKEYKDCGGLHDHGLPFEDGEEFVYPVLITLLNKLQNSFNRRVVVTSGHRCPKHNAYITLGRSKISRYMIGAKVDFYLEGLEAHPEQIIEKVMDLYSDDEDRYRTFRRISHDDGSYSWRNKEISVTVKGESAHTVLEGKTNPVISIEVRYDREKEEAVTTEWNKAYQGYIRH